MFINWFLFKITVVLMLPVWEMRKCVLQLDASDQRPMFCGRVKWKENLSHALIVKLCQSI